LNDFSSESGVEKGVENFGKGRNSISGVDYVKTFFRERKLFCTNGGRNQTNKIKSVRNFNKFEDKKEGTFRLENAPRRKTPRKL